MAINIRHNLDDLARMLNDVQRRQVPFAASVALNKTAEKIKIAAVHEMRDVFDRPTEFTLKKGVYIKRSTKSNLVAEIGLETFAGKGIPASKYLAAQVRGGERRLKRFERALRSVGVLPEGMYAMPGSGARLDYYGNMSTGQIVQILAYFKAFREGGYKANMTEKGRKRLANGSERKGTLGFEYFVGRPGDGKLPLGVWQRFRLGHGSAIKPVLIFVDSARYEAIFDFGYVAEKTAQREFASEFEQAFTAALETAR